MTESKAPYHALPRESEEAIQESICTFLRLEGWTVFEFAKPRSRPGCKVCGEVVGHLAGSAPLGWPDLLVFKPCRGGNLYLHLEVKRRGEKPSKAQRECHAVIRAGGGVVYTLESVDDVAQLLQDWGFVLRTGILSAAREG